jgi:hypothetical protein
MERSCKCRKKAVAGKKGISEKHKTTKNEDVNIALRPTRINKHLCANHAFKRNFYIMAVGLKHYIPDAAVSI